MLADRLVLPAARLALLGLPYVATSLWGGILVTVVVSAVGIVFSLPLGILLALGRRSEYADRATVLGRSSSSSARRAADHGAVHGERDAAVVRAGGWSPDKLLRALIGVALFAAAYMAEVVRGGLQAIPRGQYEARRRWAWAIGR